MESTINRAANEVKEKGGKMSSEMEHLKSSFTQLRNDVMDLVGSALGVGKTGAEAARDGASSAVESLKARLHDLKDKGADQMSAVERKIEDNPLPAALIAFGVGFLIAKILTRR